MIKRLIKRHRLSKQVRELERRKAYLLTHGFPIKFEGKPSLQENIDDLYNRLNDLL